MKAKIKEQLQVRDKLYNKTELQASTHLGHCDQGNGLLKEIAKQQMIHANTIRQKEDVIKLANIPLTPIPFDHRDNCPHRGAGPNWNSWPRLISKYSNGIPSTNNITMYGTKNAPACRQKSKIMIDLMKF